jgi:hypothetical protein
LEKQPEAHQQQHDHEQLLMLDITPVFQIRFDFELRRSTTPTTIHVVGWCPKQYT